VRTAFLTAIGCLTALAVAPAGCSPRESSSPPTAKRLPALAGLPAEITVKQRTTSVVPGSAGLLRLTIDDITSGQVMASLVNDDGAAVLSATSLSPGDSASFRFGDQRYQLVLKELNNALVGEDFATFVISRESAAEPMSEQAKIDGLLSMIESAEGDVFIRNGSEHSAKDAAEHLRNKWKSAGNKIVTAEQFIDEIATKSSLTGEPYRIRRAGGAEILAGDYLRGKLHELELGKPHPNRR
jgi:hypothetical protein